MDAVDHLMTALLGRYEIEREIGAGGMATVYAARDVKHERTVALKVLAPDLSASVGSERFLREIKFVARLQHPHILPLYDSGDADGVLFYVMPFVEGDSLRARLGRDGRLSLDEALRIGKEIASALDYAHRSGVVHRDIKPENVLLQDGHAIVADFGVARALSFAGSPTLTHTGLAIGTAAYMSPEQAAGERDLDGRSDIYSLGCVLYEMLAGEPPFTGPTAQAVIAKRFMQDAPSVARARDDLPSFVDTVVSRAMAREVADRFSTAGELAAALLDRNAVRPRPARSPRSSNSEAVALYENARTIIQARDRFRLGDAIAQLERAIALDPAFGAAEASAAVAHVLRADLDVDLETATTAAIACAQRALVHDASLAEAHAALGFAYMLRWKWADAEAAFGHAMESEPRDPLVLHWTGIFLAAVGRLDQARQSLAAALDAEPARAPLHSASAVLAYCAGDNREAEARYRRSIELDPTTAITHALLGQSYLAAGSFPKANTAFARAIDLGGAVPPLITASLGCAFAAAGRRADAMEKRDELASLGRRANVSPFYEAAVRAALDETRAAFALLDRAREQCDGWLLSLTIHPWMARVRNEPGFAALKAAMGL